MLIGKRYTSTLGENKIAKYGPNGNFIYSISTNDKINVWDARSGDLIRTLSMEKAFTDEVYFYNNQNFFKSDGNYESLTSYSIINSKIDKVFLGHDKQVTDISLSKDGQYLVSSDLNGNVIIWDYIKGEEIKHIKTKIKNISTIAISPSNNNIVVGNEEGSFSMYNTWTGKHIRSFWLNSYLITDLYFSNEGEKVIAIGAEKRELYRDNSSYPYSIWQERITLWDTKTGKQIKDYNWEHFDGVDVVLDSSNNISITVAPNSFSEHDSFKTIIWNLNTGDIANNHCLITFMIRRS